MKVALVAGESSGDLLGKGLIREIRRRIPDAQFEGVAGPEMQSAGCDVIEPSESLAVFGLVEPLRHIPRLLRLRKALVRRWSAAPPDVFIGIDAPDFNLSLERRLRRHGVKTVHYVSPSIWAWRPGRIKTVGEAADKVLCILPFEKSLYDEAGIPADFVGHPRADSAPDVVNVGAAREELGIAAGEVVAVLPGSRMGEVKRLGGIFATVAAQIRAQRPSIRFVTPIATPRLRPLIEQQLQEAGVADAFELSDNRSEQALAAADVVLLASGTAALEAALLAKPMVAAYRLAAATHFLLTRFRLLKLRHFTLPNLLTEEPLVEEFMQSDAKAELISAAVMRLLDDPGRRESIAARFAKLRDELAQNTDQRAADAVIELARR